MKQRELKFRAFNGEQMISPDYLNRDGYAYWKENSIPSSSNKVMQSTGLKDKNETSIYEDDIVECLYWEPSKYRIVFIEGAFCLGDMKTGGWVADCTHMEDSTGKHFAVIGNIHQNPELL